MAPARLAGRTGAAPPNTTNRRQHRDPRPLRDAANGSQPHVCLRTLRYSAHSIRLAVIRKVCNIANIGIGGIGWFVVRSPTTRETKVLGDVTRRAEAAETRLLRNNS
jgi:hypothetical protein